MDRHFHEDMNAFNKKILEMAALAEEAIYKVMESLKDRDVARAQEVIENDERIDELENTIEEMGIDILALMQPVAVDLRFVTTGMKLNSELERIADLAVNIAQRILEIADEPLIKPLIDIPKLSDVARQMVRDAINSFVNRDQELARQVIRADVESDVLRNSVQKRLIYEYMCKDGACAPRAVPLLLIARHLERICDHATNIAEDVIYMVEAKVVKHKPKELDENA